MKLITAFAAIAALIACCFPAPAALAEPMYGRADCADAYLCSEKSDSSSLFAVPETYCVQILGDDGEWLSVRYAEDDGLYEPVTGYIRREKLTVLDYKPEIVYLSYPLTLNYTAETPPEGLKTLPPITVTAAYYGVYSRGGAYCAYVGYARDFGYIPGAHDDYPRQSVPSSSPAAEAGEAKSVNVPLIAAIALSVAAAAALVSLYFAGRRGYSRRLDKRQ